MTRPNADGPSPGIAGFQPAPVAPEAAASPRASMDRQDAAGFRETSTGRQDAGDPRWRRVPLDAVVLSLSVLYALVRPPDAASTAIAVFVTFLAGLYWVVALLGRRAGEPGGRTFRIQ